MNKKLLSIVCVIALIGAAFAGGWFTAETLRTPEAPVQAGKISNPANEYLLNSAVFQLSAESHGLMEQAFGLARSNIEELLKKCADPDEPDWQLTAAPDGTQEMRYRGRRAAIICDIDDTLVDGAHYTADILGNDGDWNNASFARFVMSDGCTALPGAVDFIRFCESSGVEVFYVTNRYDQAYKVGQSDSCGSYETSIAKDGKGAYVAKDGTEIGSSLYQQYGLTAYDITLQSMQKLGFPIDDRHLIVNDNKLNGSSKEAARAAIREGCTDYPNGQRENENASECAVAISAEPHEVVMLLGDQLTDFTDDFSGIDAPDRTELTARYAEKFGTEWILLPNAVYGQALDSATAYGLQALMQHYAYTNAAEN